MAHSTRLRDIPDGDRASMRIVDAVARHREVHPTELHAPLYAAIDPEALDRLVDSKAGGALTVTFEYAGHSVLVEGEVRVTVDDTVHDSASEFRSEG
ncbi:HalOD1 output domain-containing protein [Natrarchaeobaculum sulfurireducens]|uniref:Halobacterial output domain-containing protein n=1 Tax=Natrarchaeobaculum sulfurireducens TaxID=2044521 RepID=A0A346PTG2_9EURY|nr:HalOD1 output domain-containing protein [Natrarchaeobaculum sulfurireducens]AXR82807.1 hypothetical protein AArcMg_2817 [Natrarchaeobaculum sulfurireducens]